MRRITRRLATEARDALGDVDDEPGVCVERLCLSLGRSRSSQRHLDLALLGSADDSSSSAAPGARLSSCVVEVVDPPDRGAAGADHEIALLDAGAPAGPSSATPRTSRPSRSGQAHSVAHAPCHPRWGERQTEGRAGRRLAARERLHVLAQVGVRRHGDDEPTLEADRVDARAAALACRAPGFRTSRAEAAPCARCPGVAVRDGRGSCALRTRPKPSVARSPVHLDSPPRRRRRRSPGRPRPTRPARRLPYRPR